MTPNDQFNPREGRAGSHCDVVSLASALAEAPLLAILDTSVRFDLSPAAILTAILRAGVKVVQYRHKDTFRRTNFEECCVLSEAVHREGGIFFVNDRADVAALCRADGVHLGQDDLPPDKARRFLGSRRLIGYSTHNREQAMRAAALQVDYIAVGPIFATASKKNPDPVVGLDLVYQVRGLTAKPIVAIGGITAQNARSVLDAGANAVAVIRDLLIAPDIERRAAEFLTVLREGKESG